MVASPKGEPLGSPGDCQTENPIEASHGYGVFVEGDVTLTSGQVTGWLGLGGELTWLNNLAVATGNDLLRNQWFYQHSNLAGLRFDYPGLR